MEFVGIDKMSLLDYEDYVSCVLFTPACNFRCPFCHNGESVLESTTFIPFQDILDYLNTRKGLIDAVVISGGEPTLMPELQDRIIALRNMGFRIKLDTNGTNPDILEKLVRSGLVDYVAMDIKNSIAKYPMTAGVENVNAAKIIRSINFLKEGHVDYEFRTTLVKEFHNLDDAPGIGELVRGAKRLYLQKFVDREGVIRKGLHPVDEGEALALKQLLGKYVDSVELRGY